MYPRSSCANVVIGPATQLILWPESKAQGGTGATRLGLNT